MNNHLTVSTLTLSIFLICSGAMSQRVTEASLRGLKTLAVLVTINQRERDPYDDLKDEIKTATQLKLRQAGLKVLERDVESVLSVQLVILKTSTGYVYGYDCSLLEEVSFKRNNRIISTPASKVWYGALGVGTGTNVYKAKELLMDEIDRFINDWLGDNQ